MVGFIPVNITNGTNPKEEGYQETPSILNIEQIKTICFFPSDYAEVYYIGPATANTHSSNGRGYEEAWDFIKCSPEKRQAIINLLTDLKLYHKLLKPKNDESTNNAPV